MFSFKVKLLMRVMGCGVNSLKRCAFRLGATTYGFANPTGE
jgi:hypothetical protein